MFYYAYSEFNGVWNVVFTVLYIQHAVSTKKNTGKKRKNEEDDEGVGKRLKQGQP